MTRRDKAGNARAAASQAKRRRTWLLLKPKVAVQVGPVAQRSELGCIGDGAWRLDRASKHRAGACRGEAFQCSPRRKESAESRHLDVDSIRDVEGVFETDLVIDPFVEEDGRARQRSPDLGQEVEVRYRILEYGRRDPGDKRGQRCPVFARPTAVHVDDERLTVALPATGCGQLAQDCDIVRAAQLDLQLPVLRQPFADGHGLQQLDRPGLGKADDTPDGLAGPSGEMVEKGHLHERARLRRLLKRGSVERCAQAGHADLYSLLEQATGQTLSPSRNAFRVLAEPRIAGDLALTGNRAVRRQQPQPGRLQRVDGPACRPKGPDQRVPENLSRELHALLLLVRAPDQV